MKKKTNLHTNFIKFILEKYNKEDVFPDEDTNVSDDEIIDDIDKIKIPVEVKDEDEEETIEDLIKEFNGLEKKYKTLRNDKVHNKKR